ncbi:MAG: pyruvate dehydrogenase complex E1 component subunit beta [bacterium]
MNRTATYTQMLRETLGAALRRDPRVFLMGEDIGAYGGAFGVTRGLAKEFGAERVRDTPISEQALVGAAIGAAAAGSRPVVEIMFMDFITLAVDQLVNMAAKLHYIYGVSCPVIVRTPSGGGRGYGATHSQSLERLFTGVPGLQVAAPATALDASALLQTALLGSSPVIFLEHKLLYPLRWEVPEGLPAPQPFGQARIAREGTHVTLVAWSGMVVQAERAAEALAAEGIHAEVIDLRTLAPLDSDTVVASVRKTGRVLLIEEGPRTGGFAAEIACRIFEAAYDSLDAPIRRLACPDCPVPAARTLEAACIPNAETITKEVRAMMGR